MRWGILIGIVIIVLVCIPIITTVPKPDQTNQPKKENQVLGEAKSIIEPTPTMSNTNIVTESIKLKENLVNNPKTFSSPPTMAIEATKNYTATLETTDGMMKINLFVKENPITVNNFVFLANQGFYDHTIFHRIIKGFMIQGGDPLGNGTGSPGYKFADEKITRDYKRGTIAMANSGANTNGSQFFIMHADYPLPKNYVIFGEIDPADSTSLTTLDAIANTSVIDNGMGETSKPTTLVSVKKVTIEVK
jgi:cyclophilin family peptidyl-prolyl cis-trans isomerase